MVELYDHGTLNFIVVKMNAIMVETWEAFKLSSYSTTKDAFKKKQLLPRYPPDQDVNHQACLTTAHT